MTPIEEDDWQRYSAFLDLESGTESHWQASRGLHVITMPVATDGKDDVCPAEFPVRAKQYGAYYLPSDELYTTAGIGTFGDLCFLTERDAVNSGYKRGPHS